MKLIEQNSPIVGSGGVLTQDLGIETLRERFTPLIRKGTRTPCETTLKFSTATDHQRTIKITVLRGVDESTRQHHLLGRYMVDDLPDAPKGVPLVLITFKVLASGDIILQAADGKTGSALPIVYNEEEVHRDDWD
jgi:molecular chaperone DnaK (HSP70)